MIMITTNNRRTTMQSMNKTHELKKRERKEHSNEILSKLTHGAEDSDILESSNVKSPGKISSSGRCFMIKDLH